MNKNIIRNAVKKAVRGSATKTEFEYKAGTFMANESGSAGNGQYTIDTWIDPKYQEMKIYNNVSYDPNGKGHSSGGYAANVRINITDGQNLTQEYQKAVQEAIRQTRGYITVLEKSIAALEGLSVPENLVADYVMAIGVDQ